MRKSITLAGLVTATLISALAFAETPDDANEPAHKVQQDAGHEIHWGYSGEGGPDHWAQLAPQNQHCSSGAQQSPIDLNYALVAGVTAPATDWSKVSRKPVINNGHTIQLDLDGAGVMTIDGEVYSLKQVHFHHPSEHTINGRHYPMEAHFVHAAESGRLAVVGVMFEEGESNPSLDPIWAVAPVANTEARAISQVDPMSFLPANHSGYRYQGSLTTPPCSETVTWTVLDTPAHASRGQLEAFAALYPNNARPIQSLNRRYVLRVD